MQDFLSVHQDDGTEADVLQAVAATMAAVLDDDDDEEKGKWGGFSSRQSPQQESEFHSSLRETCGAVLQWSQQHLQRVRLRKAFSYAT